MGPYDPLAPLYNALGAWSDQIDTWVDLAPFALLFFIKIGWNAFGVGLFIYALIARRGRKRTEQRRIARGANGAQKLLSQSRISIANDFLQQSIAAILIGVVALLTPQPVRPSVTAFFLLSSGGFMFLVYKSFHAASTLYSSDRAVIQYLRDHPTQVHDLISEDDED